MPPCIEDIANPIPGDVYDVPVSGGRVITGVRHIDDSFFLSADCHWHVDSRFEDGMPTSAERAINQPTREERVCKRSTPVDFPSNFGDWALALLYTTFGSVGAKCGVCPHKGMPVHNGICSGHRMRFKENGECEFQAPYFFVSSEGERFQSDKIWDNHFRYFTFNFKKPHGPGWYFDFVDATGRFIRRLDDYGAIANGNFGQLPVIDGGDTMNIREDAYMAQPCKLLHATEPWSLK